MVAPDGNGSAKAPEQVAAVAGDGTDLKPALPEEGQSTGVKPSVGGSGATSPAWMAQLPVDLKADPELAKYATLGDFVKATRKGPADGSKQPDGTQAKGTEPVKYKDFNKSLDEDSDPLGMVGESLKATLEASGIPEAVAVKVFETLTDAQKTAAQKLVEKGKDWCEAQLKKSWGQKYDEKRAAMTRAYIAMVQPGSDLAKALDRTGASINPAVAELLARIGSSIKEDGKVPSNASGGKGRDPRVPVKYPD